jgi:hypothetical protein
MSKQSKEFQNFDTMMRKLIRIPHDKIKAELDKEKAEKKKPKRPRKTVV